MAVMTLEEIKKGMSDKVFGQIVDIFLRNSEILQVLPFDDCVSAVGGGSTMKYKYMRKVLPATAQHMGYLYCKEHGLEKYLQPGETLTYHITTGILSPEESCDMKSKIESLK